MSDARFAIEVTLPGEDPRQVYVVACCAQGALSSAWDEDGMRWRDLYDGWDAKVIWSEDPDDGTPDTGVDVCEECAEPVESKLNAILADPEKRRRLMVGCIQAIQSREGIDTTQQQGEAAYDRVQAEKDKGTDR